MPQPVRSDIDEAKRRVQEMKSRAKSFVEEEPNEPLQNEPTKEPNVNQPNDLLSSLTKSNDSSLILALVLILSREKADNMLILALLYILL